MAAPSGRAPEWGVMMSHDRKRRLVFVAWRGNERWASDQASLTTPDGRSIFCVVKTVLGAKRAATRFARSARHRNLNLQWHLLNGRRVKGAVPDVVFECHR